MLLRLSQRSLFWSAAAAVALAVGLCSCSPAAPDSGPAREVLFCFWNVENFFDDKDDGHRSEPDRTFDKWFADDPKVLREKLDKLRRAILNMNDGKGPDILALAEVESERAADLLRQELNKHLKDPKLHYKHVLYKDPHGGRHIATAILTRLDVDKDRTQLHGRRLRILEGHILANGHELVVIASHWTSRVSDKEGEGRDKYADVIYGRYRAMYKSNPKVAFLVCGDFNDPPSDASVTEHLHAIGDLKKVLADNDPPLLLDLFAKYGGEKAEEGSHYDRGRWIMFDQIAVSPGLLDEGGWTCEPGTARIVKNEFTTKTIKVRGKEVQVPHRFGTERDKGDRGPSDHLPVTVRLKVAGK